ncbi:hypothetical protein PO909_031603 [Leuciscus waleckii]
METQTERFETLQHVTSDCRLHWDTPAVEGLTALIYSPTSPDQQNHPVWHHHVYNGTGLFVCVSS